MVRYIYIYILRHPSCARRHPGTVTAVPSYGPHLRGSRPGPLPAGTFRRVPGGCLRWPPTPPAPRWPPANYRSFTSIQMVHTHTHIIIFWGDMAQKLFWISEKGPLSGAARSHANPLRSGSVPPLQRFCQEAVLHASGEKCVACTCCRASRPRALEYII